jgi:hypothetical protein
MKIRMAHYEGHSHYSFHGAEPAEILGVRFVKPTNDDWRLCFYLRYSNGDEDFSPVDEALSQGYVKRGKV